MKDTIRTKDGKLTRTYRKWSSMLQRCHNPNHERWKYYGGKGVQVCEEWRNNFEAFLAYMGEAPPGMWLDRIDNSKGYRPGNCRWVTAQESANNRNQGRNTKPGSLRQQAIQHGIPYHVFYSRVHILGWSIDDAKSIPVEKRAGRIPDALKVHITPLPSTSKLAPPKNPLHQAVIPIKPKKRRMRRRRTFKPTQQHQTRKEMLTFSSLSQ